MKTALLAALLCLAPQSWALQSNVGSSAAQFLELGAGARALGMGEAYSAVADGPDAVYWNPAGLAQMTRPEIVYARSELPAGLHHDFVAAGAPLRALEGVLAFAFTRLSQESLDMVNASNQVLGSFSPHSEVYALAYGHKFPEDDPAASYRGYYGSAWDMPAVDRPFMDDPEPWTGEISAGLSLKAIQESLGTRKASAFALDGGGTFRPEGLHELVLAGAFRNLGSKMRFISYAEPLPAELAGSAAYEGRAGDWRWLPALEADLPYAGNPYAKLGFEARRLVSQGLWAAGRLGFSSRTVPDLGAMSGLTAGVGLRAGGFSFDAAFQPMAVLGESFRLGAGWRF